MREGKESVMARLVIFDLDGTLVDAYKAIEKSLNFTLKKLGHPQVSAYKVRRSVGWGDENFIKRFIEGEEARKALSIYRRHHRTSLLKYSRLMSQAKGILTALKKRGCKLAIASNRPKRFTDILMGHLGLKDYFDLVVCAKNKDEIKPNPILLHKIMRRLRASPDEALYVGDMTIDVRAGKNAGIRTIAVLGGSSSTAELKRARPFRVISKLSELMQCYS